MRDRRELQINRLLPEWMPPDDWNEEHALGFTDHQRFPPIPRQPSKGRREDDSDDSVSAAQAA